MAQNAPIQSIERAISILFAVAGTEQGRTLEQIARATNLNPSTVYRLARTLEGGGMLVRATQPPQLQLRFRIGPAIAELKHLDDDRHLIALASRVLVRCQARSPECNLGLVERIAHESCERVRVTAVRPGTAIVRRTKLHHPYGKASPLLFLAYATPDERDDFFRRHPFEREGRDLWGDLARLEGFLADVVRLGYAQPDFPDGKWFRLAVPVFARDGHLAAAVGGYVETGASQRTRQRLLALCRNAAEEIGREL